MIMLYLAVRRWRISFLIQNTADSLSEGFIPEMRAQQGKCAAEQGKKCRQRSWYAFYDLKPYE
jgi:hypothetical protein